MPRPEYQAPPENFYDTTEANKYTQNTRIIKIQRELTLRCMELCTLPMLKTEEDQEGNDENEEMDYENNNNDNNDHEMDSDNESTDSSDQYQTDPKLVLDIGCGSALSGEILSEHGHEWIGTDISDAMLNVAVDREVDNDLIKHDMGHGLPFRPGTFDAAISVSALQWLCNEDKSVNKASKRLRCFFESLYSCLKTGAKAALQFYPENADQVEFILTSATRAGFTGGHMVDFPNSSKKKKHYLLLFCGISREEADKKMPLALGESEQIKHGKRERLCDLKRKGKISKIDWIKAKKDKRRAQGKNTARDSKYTGRKRGPKF